MTLTIAWSPMPLRLLVRFEIPKPFPGSNRCERTATQEFEQMLCAPYTNLETRRLSELESLAEAPQPTPQRVSAAWALAALDTHQAATFHVRDTRHRSDPTREG